MMDEKLPEGWISARIGEIGWVTKLAGFEFTNYFKYQDSGPVRVIRGLNVGFGSFKAKDFKYIDQKTSDALPRSQLNGGELLMAYVGTLGTIAILPKDGYKYHLGPNVCKIVLDSPECSSFIKYFLMSPIGQERINLSSKAVAQSSLSMEQIRTIEVCLAPLPEQTRIVAAIEQQFTRLDSAVASLQSAQARTKQYRASLLKSAVEGELTKEWRAEHPAQETGAQLLARILSERRKRWEDEQLAQMREKGNMLWDDKWKQAYKEPQGPDVEGLPELPQGWCWATVEQIADVIGGVTKGRNLEKRTIITLPYLRVANVQKGFLDLDVIKTIEIPVDEVEKYLLLPGDVLLTEGGDADKLGRAAIWKGEVEKCIHQNHIFRARLIETAIPPLWLVFYANSEQGRSYFLESAKQTVNLASINLTQLRNCPIPLPPLAEQAQIVAEVEEKLSNIEQMEATIEHSLRRAEHERQSILREAFAGRLVAQDPSDEPASVLLERIREERKRRAEVEEKRKRESKVEKDQQKKRKKVAPLYDVLLEAGGALTPQELYKRSEDQRKTQPEQERDEAFYIQLDTEEAASLIAETRPAYNEVVLRALEQDEEEDEDEESEEAVKEQSKQSVEQRKTLWDA